MKLIQVTQYQLSFVINEILFKPKLLVSNSFTIKFYINHNLFFGNTYH